MKKHYFNPITINEKLLVGNILLVDSGAGQPPAPVPPGGEVETAPARKPF